MPIRRLYREDLERWLTDLREQSDDPTMDGIQLASSCHPAAHVDVMYFDGALHVRCAACQQLMAAVVVEAWASPRPEIDT